ncbi:discoidin domain-containing protein [Paenibacillus athensensis]|uniref:Uncharacterized protein n=1 Tax=Paenibacillus athensensis TaxID=1967502 RepID=A0A4Y8PXQ0_9BACL|nr:glycosyl hydrolase [Paenibacillus athensensis]MCD1259323.1 discoidin domain-containing protein [Paenibacillus athensensis]
MMIKHGLRLFLAFACSLALLVSMLTVPVAQAAANPYKTLVTPGASNEALSLISYMADVYGKKTISGQYGSDWADWVKSKTGKTPAILGLDFMDITPVRIQNGANSQDANKGIDWYNNKKGIVTISWHWDAPKNVTGEWYKAFYTNATSFDVNYAMNNPSSQDYQLLVRDIDLAAEQLKKLQAAGVPVLWRPLHEAEGGWFWWGAKGPEACKKLWKLMFDRFQNVHHLNNLIWVWNSYDYGNSANWYPGDNYVDIISYDYPTDFQTWNNYQRIFPNKLKMFGVAENSQLPNPDNFNSQPWSYFVTWVDFVKNNNSEDYVRKVYNDARTVTLESLPDLKNYPRGTDNPPSANLALNHTATASSTDDAARGAANAFDGNPSTRWSSAYNDPQWVSVDLGAVKSVNSVSLSWETAYAKAFQIQVSSDNANWQTVYTTTVGAGGTQTLNFPAANARYIRMYGTQRATQWGYSLYEFEVYGAASTPTPSPTATPTATPTPTPTATPTATPTSTPTPTPTATPTATPTPTPTATPTATPTPTPTGTPVSGGLTLRSFDGSTNATNNSVYPRFKLTNTGSSAVSLSDVKIRYYFTKDGGPSLQFACDWSSGSCSSTTGAFSSMAAPTASADTYLEVGFTSSAGTLGAGQTLEVQCRFNKSDWSNFTRTNDYSFLAGATGYTDWNHITVYRQGTLVYGLQP